ncbi:MAG: hypothetical protein MI861_20415, partial [Pirellulales bacterium]|nr:hypothetical protein [Pirellulales bacterium]
MQIRSEDIVIHAFTPSDGSVSAAIKVVHRPSGKEIISDASDSQWGNLRSAMRELIDAMNPNPEQIESPKLLPFDQVRVNLPKTFHQGQIMDLTWDYTCSQWKYYVQCGEQRVSNRYVLADLDLLDDADAPPKPR